MLCERNAHTFKCVFHKCHRVVVFTSAHLADAWRETRDGQDDHVTHFLSLGYAGKVLPRDVAFARGHIEEFGVVEELEDDISPDRWTGELYNTLEMFLAE